MTKTEQKIMGSIQAPEDVRVRLTRQAEDRLAKRLQNSTSVAASDSALRDHKFAIRRIDALSDAQLLAWRQ